MPVAEAFVGPLLHRRSMGGARASPQMAGFYQETFGNWTTHAVHRPDPAASRSRTTCRRTPNTTLRSLTQLGGGTKLELDAHPASATAVAPPRRPGGLAAAAWPMVSFDLRRHRPVRSAHARQRRRHPSRGAWSLQGAAHRGDGRGGPGELDRTRRDLTAADRLRRRKKWALARAGPPSGRGG